VISMPSGVFKPYAGVSTAVLFFTKTGTGGTDKVWFYDMEADGYSLDDKRNEIKENDIPDILNRYHNLAHESERARTEKSFLVPFGEIKDNDWDLSINRYKEVIYEEIEYAAPSEIIKDIETLDKERNQALTALKEMLR
jgi:type I restriction enzyme M protein